MAGSDSADSWLSVSLKPTLASKPPSDHPPRFWSADGEDTALQGRVQEAEMEYNQQF